MSGSYRLNKFEEAVSGIYIAGKLQHAKQALAYSFDHPFDYFKPRAAPEPKKFEACSQAALLAALELYVTATPAQLASHLNMAVTVVSKILRTLHKQQKLSRELEDWTPQKRGRQAFIYSIREGD